MKKLLVTGSSGLIGPEVCRHFSSCGWRIEGIDNNHRAVFFGPQGDTRWNQEQLSRDLPQYGHHELDIRDRQRLLDLLAELKPNAIVPAAAQPSHDRAAAIPFDDFDTNAVATLNLLEGVRRSCPESPFIQMSTNKVYGDRPNQIRMIELATRWDYDDPAYADGISETFRIDQSKHSLFGASKVAADVMVQEYGRYFGMPTCCLGGGKANSCSILEAFEIVEKFTDRPQVYAYTDNHRIGDHICYFSDLGKMKRHYPSWTVAVSLEETVRQIVEGWKQRISRPGRASQGLVLGSACH